MNEIELLIGYGGVKFGDSYSSLVSTFGDPLSIEHIESFYNDELTILLVDYECFSVYLEGEGDKRITDFEVDGSLSILFGESLRGKSIDSIKSLMKLHGYTDCELEKDGLEKVLSYLDGLVDFNFEGGCLLSVMWSVRRNIDFTPRW